MEEWDPADRRPMVVIGKTTKGYWPAAVERQDSRLGDQIVGYPSHPYAMKMNSEYFVALAKTFEKRYGVEFQGIRDGAVKDARERLIQFKTNMDVVMSVLDRNGSATGWRIAWSRSAIAAEDDAAADRRSTTIRSRTSACAWRICPSSRRR